jgi:hypothetical protein
MRRPWAGAADLPGACRRRAASRWVAWTAVAVGVGLIIVSIFDYSPIVLPQRKPGPDRLARGQALHGPAVCRGRPLSPTTYSGRRWSRSGCGWAYQYFRLANGRIGSIGSSWIWEVARAERLQQLRPRQILRLDPLRSPRHLDAAAASRCSTRRDPAVNCPARSSR